MTEEKKHEPVCSYENVPGFGTIAFRKPTEAEYKRMLSRMRDDKHDDSETLAVYVKNCCIEGDVSAFLAEYPAAIGDVSVALSTSCKPDVELTTKKG